jgi:Flp pilus assembly protein protease CpaA
LAGGAFITYLVAALPWSQWTGFVWFMLSDATFGVVFAVAILVLERNVSAE